MVLSVMARRCQMNRSTTTRLILVGVFIFWTILFNMVTVRLPGRASSSIGESAPRFSHSQAVVQSTASLPSLEPAALLQGTPSPDAQTVVFTDNVLSVTARTSTPRVVVESGASPPMVETTAVQSDVLRTTVQRIMLPLATQANGERGNVPPLVQQSAEAQKEPPSPAVRNVSPPEVGSAQPPAVNTGPVENAGPSPGAQNPLSCFRNQSMPIARHFTEKEKAMFRYLFDWPEVPTSSCKRMFKMGGLASGEGCLLDGDKHVCLDEPLSLAAAHDDCLIYSFGINYDWSFDEAAEAFGCEVHSFDPSIDYPEGKRSPGITFHHFGIGRQRHVNVYGWQIYTLDEIVNMLGHQGRTIHYLKMDAEGGEFNMMAQQLLDGEGEFVLDKVEQIGFEVHFKLDPHLEMGFYRRANRSVHALRELGFNLVHWEYNKVVKERYMFPGVDRPVSLLYEVLLVKNGPDTFARSERGRREREVMAVMAAGAMKLTKSLVSAVLGT